MTVSSKTVQLTAVAARIEADDPVPELRSGAKQLVPGVGSAEADIVFVGEAPGAREDEIGEPFVGAAGKFLDEMLGTIDLQRSDIFITNIVKYRPPNNRDPHPEEIKAMMPYLLDQIRIIQPKLVVLLGRHAMSVFLPELKISEAHGRPVRKGGQVYLPLFHPAAALYNGGLRQTLVDDFALIPAILQKINSI